MENRNENCPSEPEIHELEKVLQLGLAIPEYQRPYRWKAEKHVRQLLEDLEREIGNNTTEYRIGSVILHCGTKEGNYDIVDGQQRLVTLSLILHCLTEGSLKNTLLLEQFPHADSKNNIAFNYRYIQSYLKHYKPEEKDRLYNFLLSGCTFVVLILSELSEAFQLFDSQNARGRELDPVDLLKAFHLREMDTNSEEEKKRCVEKWEKAAADGMLNTVVGEVLFQLRNWKRKQRAYFFTKDEIDEFKGVSLIKSIRQGKDYPYLYHLLHASSANSFQINETIVNGKRFFDYVDYYIQRFSFVNHFLLQGEHGLRISYSGSNRIGDIRILKLTKNLLTAYIDKFGMDEQFVSFSEVAYHWTYSTRLLQASIRYESILNLVESKVFNPLAAVESWHYPAVADLKRKLPRLNPDKVQKQIEEVKGCIQKIETNGKES